MSFGFFCIFSHSIIIIIIIIYFLRVFHISVSWWSFTEVWVKASLPKSLGLFSVFGPISTGWNDKTVTLEKTTWFHFRLMKTGFFFVADHLLVGQLCTNPKSDRSLLSCLKVTQYSTSEIRNAPLYNSCSLPIQVMTTGPLPAPSKCKSGRFNVLRVMKTKFPATVMVFGVVSSNGHIMPPHIFEVGLKVNTKVYLDVPKSVVIPWCN